MSYENANTKDKIKAFVKRYGYLMLTVIGLLAFVITIIVLATTAKAPSAPVSSSKMTFYLPIADANIAKGYKGNALQYNATLNQWEVHKGIDFTAPVGTSVCSVLSGKVSKIYNSYLEGTVVEITHAGNLVSRYASLDEDVKVKEGDSVAGGQQIGTVASSAKGEASDGAHLHFELLENDKKIDPSGYLNISNK